MDDKTKPAETGGPMKFPYTFTAKMIQFPWRFYRQHNWIYRYYFIAVIACIPVFYKINKLANSEESKRKWAEVLRKDAEEHAHH